MNGGEKSEALNQFIVELTERLEQALEENKQKVAQWTVLALVRRSLLAGDRAAADRWSDWLFQNGGTVKQRNHFLYRMAEDYYTTAELDLAHKNNPNIQRRTLRILECAAVLIEQIDLEAVANPRFSANIDYLAGLVYYQLNDWASASEALMSGLFKNLRHKYADAMCWMIAYSDGVVGVSDIF